VLIIDIYKHYNFPARKGIFGAISEINSFREEVLQYNPQQPA
jgi:hypothetical protein